MTMTNEKMIKTNFASFRVGHEVIVALPPAFMHIAERAVDNARNKLATFRVVWNNI